MRELIDQIKKTIVFLGRINEKGEPQFSATGFLLQIQNIFHLATAKHVVVDPRTGKLIDEGMSAFFNLKDGTIGSHQLEAIKMQFGVKWIFHENKDVDVAMIPFALDIERQDVKIIPDSLFMTSETLFELYDIFFLSYQPGIQINRKITPVFRTGTISLINGDGTFYIDASAFPGNSGSPVFIKPSPIRFDAGNISIGGDPLGGKFAGIIGEYLPYQEVAVSNQTGRARVIFEENTGLSKVWSVSFIQEIIDSNAFKEQLNKLIKK